MKSYNLCEHIYFRAPNSRDGQITTELKWTKDKVLGLHLYFTFVLQTQIINLEQSSILSQSQLSSSTKPCLSSGLVAPWIFLVIVTERT